MTPRAQQRVLDELERIYGARIRRAFERSVQDWRNGVRVGEVTRMLAAGDVASALAAIGIADTLFRDIEAEIEQAFEQAGRAFTKLLPKNVRDPRGLLVQFRFDLRHPQAEQWLRTQAGQFITRLAEGQRASIMSALVQGLREGRNPRSVALDVVGRIDPASGLRKGGILGLNDLQRGYLTNAERYLRAGDGAYLRLELRDRRFDARIKRAMRLGEPIPESLIERALGRYSDRMLRHRGEMVSRTETLNALRAGKHNAFVQGAQTAGVPADAVIREWSDTGDGKVREDHAAADGQTVTGDEPFVVGGYQMRFPGDSSLGAPAEQTMVCRCQEIHRIDFIGEAARGQPV